MKYIYPAKYLLYVCASRLKTVLYLMESNTPFYQQEILKKIYFFSILVNFCAYIHFEYKTKGIHAIHLYEINFFFLSI